MQDLKQELATIKGELSVTKAWAQDAEKRADEANNKASEFTANHVSLHQTKVRIKSSDLRNAFTDDIIGSIGKP